MRQLIIILSVLLMASAAQANPIVSEVKGGPLTQASSFVDNDEPLQPWIQHDEPGASIQGEVLFNGPEFLKHIYTPRINVGGSVSTHGDTDYLYSGLYWDGDLGHNFYLGGFFGFAVHDGTTNMSKTNPDYNSTRLLGNRVLFRLGPEIGYNLTENWNVAFTWAHLSHGWILTGFDTDEPNEGLDQLGVRVGYKF